MSKYLTSLLLLVLLSFPCWPQQQNSGDESAAETATPESAESPAPEKAVSDEEKVDEDAADDADLDLQTYDEDDDDFIPSEEIPADEPIPFPSNI